jgi:hypothetical protein
MMAVVRRQEAAARKAKRDEARAQQLAAQLVEPGAPDAATLLAEKLAENEALKRQLKAARTRVQNLSVEARMAWQASKVNPVAIKQRIKLLRAFHPDKEVSEERRKELNEALQIFNALKWRVLDTEPERRIDPHPKSPPRGRVRLAGTGRYLQSFREFPAKSAQQYPAALFFGRLFGIRAFDLIC